jgi:predicted RNA-binding Zn ribbon-like protein
VRDVSRDARRAPTEGPGFHRGFLQVGRLCLDFAHTGAREGRRGAWEYLEGPGDLARWLGASSLGLEPAVRQEDFERAVDLREAVWHAVDATLAERPVPADDLQVVNLRAGDAPLVPHVDPASGLQVWHEPNAAQALSVVARDAVELFGDPRQRGRLRECASADCTITFYDDSRPGNRRWCFPERCGDRNRARAYRSRRRPTGG